MSLTRAWMGCGWCVCLAVTGLGGHQLPATQTFAPEKHCLEPDVPPPPVDMPRELAKVSMPDYVIEPPDILLIDAVQVIPLSPYQLRTLDVIQIQVDGTLPDSPIDGATTIEPGGVVNLGPPYGSVRVVGMTAEEAKIAIQEHLEQHIREPDVSVSLVSTAAQQQIAGEHLVGPDGKVTLGTYGKVYVSGMTQEQARAAIEARLAKFLEAPEVSVDVFAYNSKVYYVVTQGAGLGDGVVSFPITGNETVLDAIVNINGLESVSSSRIWIARPAPQGMACDQILPVDWHNVSQRANTTTNYQIMPGDRVYVAHDRLVALDTAISKITAPIERIFGFVSLGTSSVSNVRFFKQRGRNSGFNNNQIP